MSVEDEVEATFDEFWKDIITKRCQRCNGFGTIPGYEDPLVINPDSTIDCPVCEGDGAILDIDQVKRELHDYRTLLSEVPKVYSHITGGRISKPHTKAESVIALADELGEGGAQ